MTSIAGFLASLAGGAPQEGQKATLVNGAGTIGLFSALISATGASTGTAQTTEGETTSNANPLALTLDIPNPQIPVGTTDGEAALGEVLSEGLALPSGEVEAGIIESSVPGDGEAAAADTPVVPSTSLAPSGEAAETAETPAAIVEGEGEKASPAQSSPADVIETDNPETTEGVQDSAPAEAQPAATPSPASTGGEAAAKAQTPQSESVRPTGLENALTRGSEKRQQHGLLNALSQAPRARGTGETPQQGRSASLADTPRPSASGVSHDSPGKPAQVAPGQGRPEFAALETKPIQRVIDAGNGQTQIQIHNPTGGEINTTSPPTLTVNGPASAASPGPVSPNTPHVPVSALAVHIAQQANNGARRFDIQIDPPELGRVEVRLDVSREGHVTTHLVVERAETLDLLQRDARHLERMLQDAGLNTSEDGMKFSLKDQGQANGGDDNPGAHGDDSRTSKDDVEENASAVPDSAMPPPQRYLASTGIDIRI